MHSKRKIHRSKLRKKSPKSNSKIRLLIFFVIVILMYLFVQGDQGFLKYIQLQREKKQLLKRIEELKKEHNYLISEIDLLTNNYRYIEKIAREQHKMGKEKEKIYIMSEPKK